MSEAHPHVQKRWKARLIVCGTMLVLAFLGLIIMDLHSGAYWIYSQIMALLYAGLSIWLYWYLNRGEHKVSSTTIWHQILHWFGLLIAIYIVSVFVSTGIMGTTQAGLATLILLALTIFLCGVYTNPSFMLIGLTLAVFAAAAAYVQAYLSIIMIPVVILAGLVIYIMLHHDKKRALKT